MCASFGLTKITTHNIFGVGAGDEKLRSNFVATSSGRYGKRTFAIIAPTASLKFE